ncbi:MAG: NTP transferase domain-containing protein [Sphingobacteriia bacterium]|nr:NTP transferase domain-containing protein [Sphingobacteriia bacterium]
MVSKIIIDEAMLLCAGFGKRLQPLTLTTPKPLIKVNAKPIIEYTIDSLAKINIKKIIINAHYLPEQFETFLEYIKNKYLYINFVLSFEPEIMESGGGVKNAIKYFTNSKGLIINGDCIYIDKEENTFEYLINKYEENMDALMLFNDFHNAYGFDGKGDYGLDEYGRINRDEKPLFAFNGAQIIDLNVIAKYERDYFSLRDVYSNPALNIYGTLNPNPWLHIGDVKGLEEAEKFLNQTSLA